MWFLGASCLMKDCGAECIRIGIRVGKFGICVARWASLARYNMNVAVRVGRSPACDCTMVPFDLLKRMHSGLLHEKNAQICVET